jgi:c-di-GMP-binding flagellar brake protein YcgR
MFHGTTRAVLAAAALYLLALSPAPPCRAEFLFVTPAVSSDAQEKFFSGLHTIFTGSSEDRVGWGRTAFSIALVFAAGMAAAGLIIVLVYISRSFRNRAENMARSQNLFLETSIRLGLTENEQDALRSLIEPQNVMEPHTIFQSLPLFEQCVEAEVGRLLRADHAALEGPEEEMLSVLRRKLGFTHLPLEHPLVSTRNIVIGQTGSLFPAQGNRPMFTKVTVVDNNSFFFTVQYNVEKEEYQRIVPGAKVRFIFARQTDGLYGVQVAIARSREAGSLDLVHTMEIRRNQLRQHVRMETNLPLRFRLLSTKDPDKSEIQRGHLITTHMSDISGGGLSFVHEHSLRINDLISCNFDLPGVSFAGITGKIVHLTLREGKNAHMVKHHVQFVTIEQRQREQIIKYVFEKERQLSQWR